MRRRRARTALAITAPLMPAPPDGTRGIRIGAPFGLSGSPGDNPRASPGATISTTSPESEAAVLVDGGTEVVDQSAKWSGIVVRIDATTAAAASRAPGTMGSNPGECRVRRHDAGATRRRQEVCFPKMRAADVMSDRICVSSSSAEAKRCSSRMRSTKPTRSCLP